MEEMAVLALVYLFVPEGEVLPVFRKHCRTWFLSQFSLKLWLWSKWRMFSFPEYLFPS